MLQKGRPCQKLLLSQILQVRGIKTSKIHTQFESSFLPMCCNRRRGYKELPHTEISKVLILLKYRLLSPSWKKEIFISVGNLMNVASNSYLKLQPFHTKLCKSLPFSFYLLQNQPLLKHGSHRSWHTFSRTFEVHFQGVFKDFSLLFQTTFRKKMINNGLFK